MFRPSQSLLFRPRPMPTLKKFKIHPPLPLNPRESKQLLNLLTASFRQQLDAEHGQHGRFQTNPQPSASHKENGPAKPRRRGLFSEPGSQPTDKHMHSILANPLFNLGPDTKTSGEKRDPMEVFDMAVAKGIMNIDYARACLNAKKRNIIQSPVLKVRGGMKASGAGLKVLKWLISSGTANDNKFLEHAPFAYALMEYLVAEGLQEAVWKWIQRPFQDLPRYFTISDPLLKSSRLREIVAPLYLLIKAEVSEDLSLDAAYMCLSRAAGYLNGLTTNQMGIILYAPVRFLGNETTKLHPERPPPSTSAFKSFFSLVTVLSRGQEHLLAHLRLVHPSRPTVGPALRCLRQLDKIGIDTSHGQRHASDNILLGLDTAKFLLEHERYDDADWVMNFLRERYSRQLGIKERDHQLEQAKAEASSLHLLEGLSIV